MHLENNSDVLILRANPAYKFIAYLLLAAGIALSIYYIYGIVFLGERGFWTYLGLLMFSIGPLIYFLNFNFREIQMTDDFIVVKRWYWKTKYYQYRDVVSADSYLAQECLIIEMNNGSKIRIPQYLMDRQNDVGLWGDAIFAKLREKCGQNVHIENGV
jgi:hypothetical protein